MRPSLITFGLAGLALALPAVTIAQPTGAELVASDFVRPLGITTDALGRVWVAESGTGLDDSRISVVAPDGQVAAFLVDIPSNTTAEGPRGAADIALVGENLWFTGSTSHTESTLRRISTAGWSPGDPPRTMADVAQTVDVDAFVFGEGFTDTNPFGIALGPDGAIYFNDAGANVLLRYDPAGSALTVHTVFPTSTNGSQPVPTGVVVSDGRLYVSQLTGFPFTEGVARVFAVELDGSFSIHREGFTALTDIARDPRGTGALTVLQHGSFSLAPPAGWLPGTGRAIRLDDDRVLASVFDFATAAAYDGEGRLYVATLDGQLYRATSPPVAGEPGPGMAEVVLHDPRPNPTAGPTALRFDLARATPVRLAIHDVLGRELTVLVDAERPAGAHTQALDASRLAAGVYVVRLEAGAQTLESRVLVVR